jgi:hypothetical protein
VAPYFTPQWGDIPAKRWRIHPRPKAVAFCCRGEIDPTLLSGWRSFPFPPMAGNCYKIEFLVYIGQIPGVIHTKKFGLVGARLQKEKAFFTWLQD